MRTREQCGRRQELDPVRGHVTTVPLHPCAALPCDAKHARTGAMFWSRATTRFCVRAITPVRPYPCGNNLVPCKQITGP